MGTYFSRGTLRTKKKVRGRAPFRWGDLAKHCSHQALAFSPREKGPISSSKSAVPVEVTGTWRSRTPRTQGSRFTGDVCMREAGADRAHGAKNSKVFQVEVACLLCVVVWAANESSATFAAHPRCVRRGWHLKREPTGNTWWHQTPFLQLNL